MPRRNRNAGGVAKQRVRKGRKVDERSAPMTPFQGHSSPRMRPRGGKFAGR